MKRIFSLSLVLFLICSTVALAAEIPQISEDLISDAKLALAHLTIGEYDQIEPLLSFSEIDPEVSEWQEFTEDNFTLSPEERAQTEYAVAY